MSPINTCKIEEHPLNGKPMRLYVHRKGATKSFGPGHPEIQEIYRNIGQPVLIGGTMGTSSCVMVDVKKNVSFSFSSACHGAGRRMSRNMVYKKFRGRQVIDRLSENGIIIRSPSSRGVAEEAPNAYKDVNKVVDSTDRAGLACKVANVKPIICIKG